MTNGSGENTLKNLKKFSHQVASYIVASILKPGAVNDAENFKVWERHGYHITPLHFYSPIPDTRDIEKKTLQVSELPGIDLRPLAQRKLMKETFSRFSDEYNYLLHQSSDSPHAFYLDNDAFKGIDPLVYYCMIRHFKPTTIVEIGSGHSTLLGAQASRLNDSTRYVCIDPWPRDFILKDTPGVELVRDKVENINLDVFQQLRENDILFVDSSHVVRTANDVCFLILEVLPRLAPGVIVHFHDIFLPFDYPKEWIVRDQRFWTEQYLLQAYLTQNHRVEVLFASHFISEAYREEVLAVFPNAEWIGGGSFWFRTKTST